MKVSDGIAVLALTSLAYLCTFAYELGFCLHYGIPRELIQISISNILFFGVSLITLFCALINPIEDFLNIRKSTEKNTENKIIKKLKIKYSIISLLFFLPFFIFPFRWLNFILMLSFLTLLILEDFVSPLFHTHLTSYKEKLEFENNNKTKKSISSFIENKEIRNTFVMCILSIILMLLSSMFGGLNAKFSSEHTTCNETLTVLTVYGENVIVSNHNDKKTTFRAIPITECTFETNKK